jgi:S1-C subfamily serine protease
MNKTHLWLVVVLMVSLTVLSGCSVPQFLNGSVAAQPPTATPASPLVVAQPPASEGAVAALEGTLEQIYIQVNPSVVNIQVRQTVDVALQALPEIPGFQFSVPKGQQTQEALGSGFIWDAQGHIVTNYHVVEGADKITVTFYDGTTVPAEVVGTDPDSDLAVIRADVPADRLPAVELADSTQVKVGELAVAIGNPFGLEGTMTVGIISALGRSLPAQSSVAQGQYYRIPDIIQTDAPINPGNSGGVLVDENGRVIGVTAAIESAVQSNAGIGFVIPSNIVQKVVPALIQTGSYDHPYIGISGTSLTLELAEAMDLETGQRGAMVIDVTPESPADQAGLKGSDRQVDVEGEQVRVGGDVIVAVDGQPVQEFDDLIAYLARSTEVGQTITLTVLRDGKEQAVKLTLGARPRQEEEQSSQQANGTGATYLGIVGLTLTPEIAQAMDLPADQQGVLVQQVQQASPADEAGLRGSFKPVTIQGQQVLVGGDVITAVDREPLTALEDLQAALQQYEPGQEVTLTIQRDGKMSRVNVTLGERPTA